MINRNDSNGPVGMIVIDNTLMCIGDLNHYMHIQLSLQACRVLIDKFNWDGLRAKEVTDSLANIRHQLMHLFEQSKNWEFRIKGTPLTDVCEGVDWENNMVIGRMT